MPMVKRANTHGRPCEILEGFWKGDPVGRGKLSTAERSSHTDVFLTIPLTEAQFSTFITLVPWCGVSSVV
ncbi:hypothetical protein N7455_009843 [Penicillium solitum]|uniref:uncharacterized protein n=1 Tax=Penicillium solitum TaxID=60172 RepID=UPI0032C4606D|nr:hypothetical protein N7536_009122 [Penicillium majusculum]KAJ5849987.1 hypothetical protein N7455_009843 [Penicillium solitum]